MNIDEINERSGQVVDAAMRVHCVLGPGLLEGAYEACLKAVAKLLPIHEAQLLSYLHLSEDRVGLLINFHVRHLKDGIRRLVNRL